MKKKESLFNTNPKETFEGTHPSSKQEERLYPFEWYTFLSVIFSFVFLQITSLVNIKYLLLIPLPFSFILIIFMLYKLLFPPRLSSIRITFLMIGLVVIWLSIHPAFY